MRAIRAALTVSSRSPLLSLSTLEDEGSGELHSASPKIDVVATETQWEAEGHSVMRSPLEVEGSGEPDTVSVSNDEVEWEVEGFSSSTAGSRAFVCLQTMHDLPPPISL